MTATGAVVAGAGTFEPAGGWGGDHLGTEHVELERVRVLEGEEGVPHLRYRVLRTSAG
jgi:hypothetical protein